MDVLRQPTRAPNNERGTETERAERVIQDGGPVRGAGGVAPSSSRDERVCNDRERCERCAMEVCEESYCERSCVLTFFVCVARATRCDKCDRMMIVCHQNVIDG